MLVRFLVHFGYLALFGSLVVGGLGVPVPEELVQLTAGFLARRGLLDLAPAIACAWAGIVLGDVLFFRVARRHGEKLLARRQIARLLTPARRAFLDRHFDRHAFLTVVVARHTSGFRLAAYALAATHGVSTRTFALADGISALASVPLVVMLGWWFAGRLEEVRRQVQHVELGVLAVVVAGTVAWLLWQRRGSRERPPPPDTQAAPAPRQSEAEVLAGGGAPTASPAGRGRREPPEAQS